ncbi:MAG: phosphomannomutase/phosphoglucomutase [bacterium]
MINPQIFREYDIRGVVEKDLTEEVVKTLGKAYGTYLRQQNKKSLTVGRDNRLSSERFRNALVEGLLSTGCSVIDLGVCPTPALYFSLYHLNPDAGMMITASHNPPQFNGFKLCDGKESLYGEKIQNIRKIAEQGEFIQGKGGTVSTCQIIEPYMATIRENVHLKRGLKVVVDAGNGTASPIVPDLFRKLGCKVEALFCEMDGNFPNHFPDPTVPENLTSLIQRVKESSADVGLAYDGDSDRIGVVDNQGGIIWGDQLMVIFARDILSRNPGASIIFEVKCSQNLEQDIVKHGGRPIMWKTGHSLIKKKMKEENALLAGEMSGHIFFADGYFGYDDAIFASCRLVEILSESSQTISEMISDLPKTYSTPEIRVDCADEEKFHIIEVLKEHFQKKYRLVDIDGIRILFDHGWALIRASNTQPALVLRFESISREGLEEIQNLVMAKLQENPVVSCRF